MANGNGQLSRTEANKKLDRFESSKKKAAAAAKQSAGQITRVAVAGGTAYGVGYLGARGTLPAKIGDKIDTDLAIGGVALAGALMSKKQSGRDLFEGIAMGSLMPYLRELGSTPKT
jgi:hypothetical protein